MRGGVYRARFAGRGHEQQGVRYAVVVQNDKLRHLSTWLVAPTTTAESAAPAIFRPDIEFLGDEGRVLLEQATAMDHRYLGEIVGTLTVDELRRVDIGLRAVMDLERAP